MNDYFMVHPFFFWPTIRYITEIGEESSDIYFVLDIEDYFKYSFAPIL